jgi:hypothetical protein
MRIDFADRAFIEARLKTFERSMARWESLSAEREADASEISQEWADAQSLEQWLEPLSAGDRKGLLNDAHSARLAVIVQRFPGAYADLVAKDTAVLTAARQRRLDSSGRGARRTA